MGDVLAEEELIFFISGQLSLVGENAEESRLQLLPRQSAGLVLHP